jgi:hypothetical protein
LVTNIMNNTKTLTAVSAILIAATLVVGGTLASTTAFAYQQKKGGSQENSKNGNTVTIEECKNKGSASGFDTALNQECANLICTHPGNNATCTQEGAAAPQQTQTPTPTTTTLRVIKIVDCLATDPNCSLPDICRINVISPSTGPTQVFDCEDAIGNGVLVTLQPGKFETVEVIGPGFGTTVAGDCRGTIAEGQHLTCTITNTQRPTTGTLRVIKNVVCLPTDRFCATPADFSINVAGTNCNPRPFTTFLGSATGTTITLDPCTYTVTEVGATGGTGGTITVNGRKFVVTFTGQCGPESIAAGQQKNCTVTNTETPTMQVTGQGDGQNLCPPPATVPRPASITFSAQQIGSTINGQFKIVVNFGGGTIADKTGTLNGLQISGSSFTITGTELARDACNAIPFPGPTGVTISGQCGTGVPIQFISAEGERATFTGNVACTT